MIRIDDFTIEPDAIDYRVGIIKVSEKGSEYNKLIGYYKNVESCIRAIRNTVIREKMSEIDIDSLEKVADTIDAITKDFEVKLSQALTAVSKAN